MTFTSQHEQQKHREGYPSVPLSLFVFIIVISFVFFAFAGLARPPKQTEEDLMLFMDEDVNEEDGRNAEDFGNNFDDMGSPHSAVEAPHLTIPLPAAASRRGLILAALAEVAAERLRWQLSGQWAGEGAKELNALGELLLFLV
jgi:hypothetical protein